ncbi:MAG: hypothetical protein HKP41_06605 [Desulfobacterales bacterium]|nr:hypothetical protein [Desulfobacterales bacterium]
MNLRNICFLIVALLLVSISGCSHLEIRKQSLHSKKIMIADLPSHQPGEYFIYDSGLSKIAIKRTEEFIHWQYGNGATSQGYNNFLIPQISWTTEVNTGKTTASASPDFLWPLSIGNSGKFSTKQTIIRKNGTMEETERMWECQVNGLKQITVPAGHFDTYVIYCNRHSATDGKWRGRMTYYYSPEIRQYVKLTKEYPRRPYAVEQLSRSGFNSKYLIEKDQNALQKALNKTLENGAAGVARNWKSSSGEISALLIPYQGYTGMEGQKCREYRSVYSVVGRVHQHTRKACKTADGSWRGVDS